MSPDLQMRTIQHDVARIGHDLSYDMANPEVRHYVEQLQQVRNELHELKQRNATMATHLDHATEARTASEAREAACHQLIEDLVRHVHQRDRQVSDMMCADHEYITLLSRAVRIEQSGRRRAPESTVRQRPNA